MASEEEQRRAFAEYLGATTHAGQQYFYPVARPPSPFLYQPPFIHVNPEQSHLTHSQIAQAPPAPTPPPAAPQPTNPTPIPCMPPPSKTPGYVYLPRSYTAPQQAPAPTPALGTYSAGWQYTDPFPPPPMPTPNVVSANSSRSASGEVIESRTKERSERYYRYEYDAAPPPPPPPNAPAVAPLPVLLCHTCSQCGRMRSAGFHRHNPVIPGQPLISSICRRCEKKNKRNEEERSSRRYTRIRSCTAAEPCDWPSRPIHIEIGGHEDHRGRARNRSHSDEVYVVRSRSRPHTVRRAESRTNVGLGILQDPSPPSMLRRKTEVRISSMSPPRREYRARSISPLRVRIRERSAEARMAAHHMPYRPVLPDQRAFLRESEETFASSHSAAPRPLVEPQSPQRGILKQPGMDRETAYRRQRSMHGSQESTMVEVGGPRVQFVPEQRRGDRTTSDSSREQFRSTARRYATDGQQSSSEDYDYYHRRVERRPSPPCRSFESLHIRHSSPRPESFEEVRIRRESPPPPASRFEEVRIRRESPPPPASRFEEVRVRHASPTRSFEEVRIRHASPPRRGYEEARVRHVTPPRGRSPQHHHPSSPYSDYRTFSRPPVIQERGSSLPPKPREKDWDEVTATDSDNSGEIVDVRSWRGVDENGQPATFVEERRTRRLLEEEKAQHERRAFSPPTQRAHHHERRAYAPVPGSWRDV